MRWRKRRDDEAALEPAGATTLVAAPPDAARVEPAAAVDAWEAEFTPQRRVEVPVQLASVGEDELARAIRRAVVRALAEDLGDRGDVTSIATVPASASGTGEIVARAPGVVAGLAVVTEVFARIDPRVEVELLRADGDRVAPGEVLAVVTGSLRSVLTGERTALNFLGHLSGVATQTRQFVDALAGTGAAIRDTRKTTPGLRLLEKAAVTAGGGANHRVGLFDALLVKDNHVLAAGSAGAAALRAMQRSGGRHVQVEVSRLDQIDPVLRAGVTDILLDNFTPEEVRQAVRRVDGRAALEASGNVTLANVRAYAEAGVDRIASGSLTHSAPWLDIALDIRADAIDPGLGAADDDDWSLSTLLGDSQQPGAATLRVAEQELPAAESAEVAEPAEPIEGAESAEVAEVVEPAEPADAPVPPPPPPPPPSGDPVGGDG